MTECQTSPPHFSASYCKFVKCGDYRKNEDGIGQKCCQVTGYVPGNMPQCPHDMDPGTLEKYSDRRAYQKPAKPKKKKEPRQVTLADFFKRIEKKTKRRVVTSGKNARPATATTFQGVGQ